MDPVFLTPGQVLGLICLGLIVLWMFVVHVVLRT